MRRQRVSRIINNSKSVREGQTGDSLVASNSHGIIHLMLVVLCAQQIFRLLGRNVHPNPGAVIGLPNERGIDARLDQPRLDGLDGFIGRSEELANLIERPMLA